MSPRLELDVSVSVVHRLGQTDLDPTERVDHTTEPHEVDDDEVVDEDVGVPLQGPDHARRSALVEVVVPLSDDLVPIAVGEHRAVPPINHRSRGMETTSPLPVRRQVDEHARVEWALPSACVLVGAEGSRGRAYDKDKERTDLGRRRWCRDGQVHLLDIAVELVYARWF